MNEIETKRFVLKILEEKYLSNLFKILSNINVIDTLNMERHTKIEDTKNMNNSENSTYHSITYTPRKQEALEDMQHKQYTK